MTYKKVETVAVSALILTGIIYFIAAFLGGPMVGLFHLPPDQWETLFTAWKFFGAFLLGILLGAAMCSPRFPS